MAEAVNQSGASVHLGTPVRRVARRAGGRLALEFFSGEQREYTHVVSTMPLTHLAAAIPGATSPVRRAASALRFRNTVLVYLRVGARELFPDQWIYVNSPDLEAGRITNYSNWVPELCGDNRHTVLSIELWCDPGDGRWGESNERHIERAAENLRRAGLIGKAPITGGHVVRVSNCYPIYDLGYRDHLEILSSYLKTIPGLHAIGRYGTFRYNNQDHSLLMGILAAENIALGRAHDLWKINTGRAYQEAAVIRDTGLDLKGA